MDAFQQGFRQGLGAFFGAEAAHQAKVEMFKNCSPRRSSPSPRKPLAARKQQDDGVCLGVQSMQLETLIGTWFYQVFGSWSKFEISRASDTQAPTQIWPDLRFSDGDVTGLLQNSGCGEFVGNMKSHKGDAHGTVRICYERSSGSAILSFKAAGSDDWYDGFSAHKVAGPSGASNAPTSMPSGDLPPQDVDDDSQDLIPRGGRIGVTKSYAFSSSSRGCASSSSSTSASSSSSLESSRGVACMSSMGANCENEEVIQTEMTETMGDEDLTLTGYNVFGDSRSCKSSNCRSQMSHNKGGCIWGIKRFLTRGDRLSKEAVDNVEILWDMMDVNKDHKLTRDEVMSVFSGKFAKISANMMFNELDGNRDNQIGQREFFTFWENVKRSGYTDKEVVKAIADIIDGDTWVDFTRDRTVSKRPTKTKTTKTMS